MARQSPFLQTSMVRPATRTAVTSTCQKPSSGRTTLAQESGVRRRSGLWPPKAISLSSPSSPSERKFLKGDVDISIAITVKLSAQGCAPVTSSVGTGAPRHTLSFTNSPLTEPVPYPMVTRSQGSPTGTSEPSRFIGIADSDAVMLYLLCTRQASLSHSTAGRTMWPEPVSKTTLNSWGFGRPTLMMPEYDVLNETTFPLRLTGTDSRRSLSKKASLVAGASCTGCDRSCGGGGADGTPPTQGGNPNARVRPRTMSTARRAQRGVKCIAMFGSALRV